MMRNSRGKTLTLLMMLTLTLVMIAGIQSAQAQTAQIYLDAGGGATQTILDNGAFDSDSRLGVVAWSGTIGIFDLSFVTGTTKPYLTGLPQIDLFNLEANSSGAGSIDVWFSETGFTLGGSSATVQTTVGGTTDDTVEFWSYIDNSNTINGTGTFTGSLGAYVDAYDPGSGDPPLGFSGTTNSTVTISSPFSITGKATITHSSANDLTSYDLNVQVVPEPVSSTLFIFGAATLGYRRFRKGRK